MKEGTPSKSMRRQRALVALGLIGSACVAVLAACSGDEDCASTATCADDSTGQNDSGAVKDSSLAKDGSSSGTVADTGSSGGDPDTGSSSGEIDSGEDDAGADADADADAGPTDAGADAADTGVDAGPPHVTLTLPATAATLIQGSAVDVAVTIARSNYQGALTLKATGLPGKITIAPVNVLAGATTATLHVVAAADQPQGNVSGITITAFAGADTAGTGSLKLFVRGPSGSLDTTFGPVMGDYGSFASAVRLDDGRVLAVGIKGSTPIATRFLPNGTLDPAFGEKALPGPAVTATRVALDATGRAAIIKDEEVVLLDSAGALVSGFGTGGSVSVGNGSPERAADVRFGPAGSVFVNWICDSGGCSFLKSVVTRLTSGGTNDTSWGFNSTGNASVRSSFQSSPAYVKGGAMTMTATGVSYYAYVGDAGTAGLTQVSVDGKTAQTVTFPANSADAFALATDAQGRVVVASGQSSLNGGAIELRRYDSSLVLDATFGSSGVATASACGLSSLRVLNDGTILVSGARVVVTSGAVATRLLSSGAKDLSYGNSGVANVQGGLNTGLSNITSSWVQPDGSVIAVGFNDAVAPASQSGILRIWQ